MKSAIEAIKDVYHTIGTFEEAFGPFKDVDDAEHYHGAGDDHALLNALLVMRRRKIVVAEPEDREAFIELITTIKQLPDRKGEQPDENLSARGRDSPK